MFMHMHAHACTLHRMHTAQDTPLTYLNLMQLHWISVIIIVEQSFTNIAPVYLAI